jgi:hypothetical protein
MKLVDIVPRPRPPHRQRERTRYGAISWYARIGKGPKIRLRATYGTQELAAEYQAAVSGKATSRRGQLDDEAAPGYERDIAQAPNGWVSLKRPSGNEKTSCLVF